MIAKVTIRKDKKLKNGNYPIAVYLIAHGKKEKRHTGTSVQEDLWDLEKNILKPVRPCAPVHKNWDNYQEYKRLRDFILDKQQQYDQLIDKLTKSGRPFTFDKVFTQIESPPQESISVFSLFKTRMLKWEEQENYGQVRIYKDTYYRLKDFLGDKDLMFFELDAEVLLEFRKYLTKRGNKNGTIFRHLRTVKAMWNHAIDLGIAHQNDYPFRRNKEIMKGLKTAFNSKPLTREDIDKIRHLDKIDKIAIKPGSKIWHAKHFFLFMYLGHGHNIGDLARFKWSDIREGRLYYTRYKTRNKVPVIGSFKISNEMQDILTWYRQHWRDIRQVNNPYIFPVLNGFHQTEKQKQTRINRVIGEINLELKRIAKEIGTPVDMTTYTARHSTAYAMVKNGVSLPEIQQVMRHSGIQTTQHYIKQFDTEEIDKAVSGL